MKQFLAVLYKESLLMSRDKAGLGLLFVMPVVFILIMSIAQDSAYKSLTEFGIPVIIVNNDNDSLGFYVEEGLEQTEFCKLHKTIDGKIPTEEEAYAAVANGDFMFGIMIPPNSTKSIRNSVEALISSTLSDTLSAQDFKKMDVDIKIIYDPTTKKSFVTTISSTLHEFISNLKSRIIFETFANEVKQFLPSDNAPLGFETTDVIHFSEAFAAGRDSEIIPNSVQHNVPAWTIFGMFFIVVPLASSIIKEKQEGSSIRLKTLPGPYVYNHLAKLFVYFLVALIQFTLMMFLAKLLLPLIGLPNLQFGNQLFNIFIVAICLALASTGFGMFTGTICTTYQQSAIGGSLTILILAALGGIWVPLHIMPEYMQAVSKISPLNWGIEAFYLMFLRDQGFPEIWPYVLSLLAFFVICMLATIAVIRFRKT